MAEATEVHALAGCMNCTDFAATAMLCVFTCVFCIDTNWQVRPGQLPHCDRRLAKY